MLVPVPVQHQIATEAPLVAYVPSRLAPGWRYSTMATDGSRLVLVFRGGTGREIDYYVLRWRGACGAGALGSRSSSGATVYDARTVDEQSAWRCVGGYKLVATTLLPPNRLSYLVLVRLVASSRHLVG